MNRTKKEDAIYNIWYTLNLKQRKLHFKMKRVRGDLEDLQVLCTHPKNFQNEGVCALCGFSGGKK